MSKKNFIPMNLQFFAEDGGENQGSTDTGSQNQQGSEQNSQQGNQSQQGNNSQSGSNQQQEKTFTQSDMTAMATREKREGKNSILKLFGISDEKSAKDEAAAYLAWKESQKTEEQKQQEATEKLQTDKTDAEKRAMVAENKLSAFVAGVNKDSLEDALAIALLKVTEDKNLDAVLSEMKEQAKYKGFFEQESSQSSPDAGTGNGVNHSSSGGNSGASNIGKRLAEKNNSSQTKKSSYFTRS